MFADTFPLYKNLGGQFEDATRTAGITIPSSSLTAWGTGIFDFDNDGYKDIFAACSAILDNSMEIQLRPFFLPNALFRNNGNLTFTNVAPDAGRSFTIPAAHRGAAFGDFNNDGKIDVVVVVLNARPELFLNRSISGNHWLLLNLVGSSSNRDGMGTRIKITTDKGVQFNHATTTVRIQFRKRQASALRARTIGDGGKNRGDLAGRRQTGNRKRESRPDFHDPGTSAGPAALVQNRNARPACHGVP